MKNFKLKNFAILFIFSNLFTTVAASPFTHRVGVLLRLEDNYNTFPQKILAGIEHYNDLKKSKLKVEIIKMSHDGTTESLASGVQSLLNKNVSVIIGGETSSDAIQISRLTADSNVAFISPTASSSKIHSFNTNSLRMMLDGDKMVTLVKEVVSVKKCKKLGVYHNLTKPNWNKISQTIIESVKSPVVVKALSDIVKPEKILRPFVESKIDCLALFSYESDFRTVYGYLLKNNIHPVYIGSDGWGTNQNIIEKYVTTAKDTHFEGYRALYWDNSRQDYFFLSTKKAFERSKQFKLGPFSAIGYDSMKVVTDILEAMPREKFSSLDFILKASEMKFYKTLTTKMLRFGPDHSPVKDLNVYKLEFKNRTSFWKSLKV